MLSPSTTRRTPRCVDRPLRCLCFSLLPARPAPHIHTTHIGHVAHACEQKWADTDTTTALWRAISSSDKEALETLLDADEQNAHVRAADGRGPLWCVVVKATGYHPCVCAPMFVTAERTRPRPCGTGGLTSTRTKRPSRSCKRKGSTRTPRTAVRVWWWTVFGRSARSWRLCMLTPA